MINLPELDLKKLTLIALFSLIFIYCASFIFLPMQIKAAKADKQSILKLKIGINTYKKELEMARQARMNSAKEKKLEIKNGLTEDQVPLLLNNISNIANKCDVKIMQVRPTKDVKPDVAVSVGALNPLAITMDLSCEYHKCGRFINLLENAKQYMSVSELKIVSDSASYLKQGAYLIIITYVKK